MSQPTGPTSPLDPTDGAIPRILPLDSGDDEAAGASRERTRGPRLPGSITYATPEITDVIGLLTDTATPARVADVECGQGWAAINLALAYPHVTVAGFGSVPEDLPVARDNAASSGVADRVTFDLEGPQTFSADDPFDLVFFFGCVHKLPAPREMVDQARRSLTDRGVVVVVSPGASEEPAPAEPEPVGPEPGPADQPVPPQEAGFDRGNNELELDPAEQVQVFFPDARVLWCPPPGLFDPGLTGQRANIRDPQDTRAWLTRRVEVDGDGLSSVGTAEGQGL